MEHFEDHFQSVWTEWAAVKDKWFHGENVDPVFEGVVRDFCVFDETMHNIQSKVGLFMKGVEQLGSGMTALSDGVSKGLAHANDSQIASDSCKLKEATNQIARADAPHSAMAKLRRDMHFNVLNPVQNHIANNRNLKVSLDIRKRRLVELKAAKKQYEDLLQRKLPEHDKRLLTAQANFESAKITFTDVDKHVFEWLYILEEYRGDILDSTLQTLKYLQYEFFATSAHAISISLPSRMEFRPMVEMTPEHLEAQVDMELRESDEKDDEDGNEDNVANFSERLIEKKAKWHDEAAAAPSLPVDPLSLSSLLSQGIEEGPARRALRLHQNDTQAALDWLLNGQNEMADKQKLVAEGVRMPTTVRRVQKLKVMRKAQAEKQQAKNKKSAASSQQSDEAEQVLQRAGAGGAVKNGANSQEAGASFSQASEDTDGTPAHQQPSAPAAAPPAPKPPAAPADLLSLDADAPTDFSREVERSALPEVLVFDSTKCEKQPLAAAIEKGLAAPRQGAGSSQGLADLDFSPAPAHTSQQAPAAGPAAAPPAAAGLSPDLLAQVKALAAASNVSPEMLLMAAQQMKVPAQPAAAPAPGSASALASAAPAPATLDAASAPVVIPAVGAALNGGASGWGSFGAAPAATAGYPGAAFPADAAGGGLVALDLMGPAAGQPEQAAKPVPTGDQFGDLFNLTGGP
eukprot:TRINITY_DN5948_c1_g4_i3.p1 TRINITY_DN5948_c1_g4~~TRINITY_DN5948_c1_g4_i3.p1  ORF type:complete len:687 (+),score=223.31 TRINITY_DN5948_c1_g4_i3:170-2230(+)